MNYLTVDVGIDYQYKENVNLKCQLLTKLKAAAFGLNSDINISLKQTLNITMSQFLVSSRCILPHLKFSTWMIRLFS